jgi:hypothetical protein
MVRILWSPTRNNLSSGCGFKYSERVPINKFLFLSELSLPINFTQPSSNKQMTVQSELPIEVGSQPIFFLLHGQMGSTKLFLNKIYIDK